MSTRDSLPGIEDLAHEVEAVEDAEVSARELYALRQRNRLLTRRNRELNRELDRAVDRISTLEELREPPTDPEPLNEPLEKDGRGTPSTFVALASDWHTCEIVTPSQTNGLNEHSRDIGEERAWAWADGLVSLLGREMETRDIRELVLWLGGDFLVNDGLHYKSERSVNISPHKEARIIRDLLAGIIAHIRAETDVNRIVIPTSFGNHDRSTDRMVPGHAADYSHGQDVYLDLQSWFGMTEPSIEFRVAESDWGVLDVHGYRLLFHHGHEIGYGSGMAGLAHPLRKAIAAKQSDLPHDTMCIGHYHQQGIYHGGGAVTNGSLVGCNGYSATKKFPSEEPAQVAFVIDHERQAIANYFLIWGR